jgi:hypothetical protein
MRNAHVASQFRGILAAFSSQNRAYEAAEERREWAREDEARQQDEASEDPFACLFAASMPVGVTQCPTCGAPWDGSHNRCTASGCHLGAKGYE